jgi:hypothetical protein
LPLRSIWGFKRILLTYLLFFMLRLGFLEVVLRFFLNSHSVFFLRLSRFWILSLFIIALDGPSCCILRNRSFILLWLFSFLKVILHGIPVVKSLPSWIRSILGLLNLYYYLDFIEIFCRVPYFFVVIALEIDGRKCLHPFVF